ncbi:hypothetical protein CDD83_636 [Cordyceps sp. RAO-2017]|nr:hypothetical protein CDD83_636 [Cordyceps sp. RAO-2017]
MSKSRDTTASKEFMPTTSSADSSPTLFSLSRPPPRNFFLKRKAPAQSRDTKKQKIVTWPLSPAAAASIMPTTPAARSTGISSASPPFPATSNLPGYEAAYQNAQQYLSGLPDHPRLGKLRAEMQELRAELQGLRAEVDKLKEASGEQVGLMRAMVEEFFGPPSS